MAKIWHRLKEIAHLLQPDKIVLMPKELKRKRATYLIASILITSILDLISLSVKVATFAIENKLIAIAFIFLVLYYLRQSLTASTRVFLDNENQRIHANSEEYINGNIIKVSNTVRGKVYSKSSGGASQVMQNSEIIFQMNNYIRVVWNFWNTLPNAIANSVILIVLSVSMVYMEWISSSNTTLTALLTILLIVCATIYVVIAKLRMKVRGEFRRDLQSLRKRSEKIKDTLKFIEPICEEEFDFRAQNFINVLNDINNKTRVETKKLNFLYVFRSLVVAAFMCIILFLKIHFGGGFSSITALTIAEVVALGAIYETILDKIVRILEHVENIINSFKDLEEYKSDFENIIGTYNDTVEKFNTIDIEVSEITMEPLEAEYPRKQSAYKLVVEEPVVFRKGKCYLFSGPTGCGKSTLIHLICGKLLLSPSPISYGNGLERGYLASLLHETNGRLGTEFVLEEIIISKDTLNFDRDKLITILKGLCLFENIKSNLGIKTSDEEAEDAVLGYLASTNIEEYSAGQKQRLSLAKILYNMKPKHQIIAFDEATNALDRETTIAVLKFIKSFCMSDSERILIFASHQIEEMMEIVDEWYTFSQDNHPISKLVKTSF